MAELLEGASGRATQRTVGRLVRLGDALREHLDEPARALAAYRNAIAIDAEQGARAGLTALLEVPTTRARAADALAQAMRTTSDVTGVLDLLPLASPRRPTTARARAPHVKPRSSASRTSTTRPAPSPISRAPSRSLRAIS